MSEGCAASEASEKEEEDVTEKWRVAPELKVATQQVWKKTKV